MDEFQFDATTWWHKVNDFNLKSYIIKKMHVHEVLQGMTLQQLHWNSDWLSRFLKRRMDQSSIVQKSIKIWSLNLVLQVYLFYRHFKTFAVSCRYWKLMHHWNWNTRKNFWERTSWTESICKRIALRKTISLINKWV